MDVVRLQLEGDPFGGVGGMATECEFLIRYRDGSTLARLVRLGANGVHPETLRQFVDTLNSLLASR